MDFSLNYAILWVGIPLALAPCIPLALRLDARTRGGALTALSILALAANALFAWELRGLTQFEAMATGSGPYPYDATVLACAFVLGGALLLVAWSLALVAEVRVHGWRLRGSLTLGVCASIAAIYGFLALGFPRASVTTACVFLSSNSALASFCGPRVPLATLTLVVMVAGPVATLIYALRTRQQVRARVA